MRILSWHIDGYGVFRDSGVTDLGSGVTVVLGENEAGKSTLLAFLRAMLFGFPDRRTRENLYSPIHGGRHGGRITLLDEAGPWTVTRYADKRKVVDVTRPDGRPADADDLRRLLSGVDATLFASVFAFGLDELQQFATLDADGVRERIFSVGISGAGQSARAVLKQLAEQESRLLKQRAGQARINDLVRDLEDASEEARRAEDLSAGYPALVRAETEHGEQIAQLDKTLADLAARRRRYEALGALRLDWLELAELEGRLSDLPEASDPGLPAAAADLVRRLLVLRSREETLTELRAASIAAQADLSQHLQRLGPQWTPARLYDADDSIEARDAVRDWRRRLAESSAAAERAARVEEGARRDADDLADDEARCAEALPNALPPSAETLGERETALRALRSNLRDLLMAELQVAPDGSALHRVWLYAAMGALAALLGAVAATFAGATQLAVGLAVGTALLTLVAVVARTGARRPRQAGGAGTGATVERLRAEVADAAGRLGLDDRPSEAELNALEARLSAARAERVTCDGTEEQLKQLAAKLQTLRARAVNLAAVAATAREQDAAEQAAWGEWLVERKLPHLSPEGVLELFEHVRLARAAHAALTKAKADLAALDADRSSWDAGAVAALAGVGTDAAAMTAPQLETAVASLDEGLAERAAALSRKGGCEQRLAKGLSELGDAREARRELAEGDPNTWRAEIARLDTEIQDADTARTGAIEARRDAQRAREALEASADVPRLQAACASLRAELAHAVHEYRVVTTASGLVRETLRGYVRDRQPGVLERASEAFTAVTGGRFRSVVQEASEDADTIVVEQWDGARLTPDQLSRGTCEQLYLAIRLALAAELADRGQELPLIMDDCLVNFDPERAAAMARLIAASAAAGQCLFFTCHPVVAELLRGAAEDTRIVTLPGRRRGPADDAPPLFAC